MFINFWYPMALSEEITDKPAKVRCIGQDFVVFRSQDGDAKCISNTCTHRGGSLANGKMKGDCIQCPYHGWEFDGDGVCHKIPSLGTDANIPARARVDAYPVQEKFGMIFAFLGDLPEAERPPIIPVPEWDQDGWRPTLIDYDLATNYERSIENGIDPAHNEFVHDTHGFSGENDDYSIGELREEHTDWGQGFWHTFNAPKLPDKGDMRKLRDYEGDLEVGTGHHGPNHVWTYIHVSADYYFHQYLFERPVDRENTHIYLLCMRNCMLEPEQDKFMNERNWYVAKQDVDVIKNLHPLITPDTNTKELMVPADKSVVMYRERVNEWTARGWRIDVDQVDLTEGRVAYAVPSPARRESKGWVLDAVPLVSASGEAQLKAAS